MRAIVTKSSVVIYLALVLFLPCGPVMADSPSAGEPLIAILDQDVNEMNKQLGLYAKTLPAAQQGKLQALLDKQRKQLDAVKASYQQVSATSESAADDTGKLNKDLAGFFATGDEIRKLLGITKPTGDGKIRTAEYSPDPSFCANHCYTTCGYNSLGDKVCWHECYKCCSAGGC